MSAPDGDIRALPVREQLVRLLAITDALRDELVTMGDRLSVVEAERSCLRCQTPPPPPPRWPGDVRARDERPPHRCGRVGWKR